MIERKKAGEISGTYDDPKWVGISGMEVERFNLKH
jgi:hypothetical protein